MAQNGAMLGFPSSLYSAKAASPALAWTGFSGSASGESTQVVGSLSAADSEGTAQTSSTALGRAQTDGLVVVATADANTAGDTGWNAIDLAVATTGPDSTPVPSGSVSAESEAQTGPDRTPIADTTTSILASVVERQAAELAAAETPSDDLSGCLGPTLDSGFPSELDVLIDGALPDLLQVSTAPEGIIICFAPIPDALL